MAQDSSRIPRATLSSKPVALAACLALLASAAAANDPFLRRTPTVLAVEKVGPAVVNITTETIVTQRSPFRGFNRDPLFERFFRDFVGPQRRRTVSSLGSGVNIDEELANLIVLQNAFAASARVISTVDRMFEELLNSVR